MLLTLEEIAVEAAMIAATVAASACFVILVVCAVLERRALSLPGVKPARRPEAQSCVVPERHRASATPPRAA